MSIKEEVKVGKDSGKEYTISSGGDPYEDSKKYDDIKQAAEESEAGVDVTNSKSKSFFDVSDDGRTRVVWLHLTIRTHWSFFILRQFTSAVASTSSDKAGKHLVDVGELHLTIRCAHQVSDWDKNINTIKISDDEWAVTPLIAYGTAWCENPKIGPLKAEADPTK